MLRKIIHTLNIVLRLYWIKLWLKFLNVRYLDLGPLVFFLHH